MGLVETQFRILSLSMISRRGRSLLADSTSQCITSAPFSQMLVSTYLPAALVLAKLGE
jgi:hypothetical protein